MDRPATAGNHANNAAAVISEAAASCMSVTARLITVEPIYIYRSYWHIAQWHSVVSGRCTLIFKWSLVGANKIYAYKAVGGQFGCVMLLTVYNLLVLRLLIVPEAGWGGILLKFSSRSCYVVIYWTEID